MQYDGSVELTTINVMLESCSCKRGVSKPKRSTKVLARSFTRCTSLAVQNITRRTHWPAEIGINHAPGLRAIPSAMLAKDEASAMLKHRLFILVTQISS